MPPSRRHRHSGHSRGVVEPRDPAETRRRWLRVGAVVAGAIFLLWLSLANTVGGIYRNQAPRLLVISPFDARLQSNSARLLVEQARSRATAVRAEAFAEQALLRDPTNVEAVWALAFVRGAQNREAQARALIAYSDRLSRRDLATRLAMIEERVQANDIDGALRNFDIALKTSAQAPTVLMPVLVSASQDDAIAPRLLTLLRTNPAWKQAFYERLVQESRSHARAVYLMQGLVHAGDPADRFIVRAGFSRFLRENDPGQAFALYDVIAGISPAVRNATIRDGGFDHGGDLPPFDWMLTAEENLAGNRQGRPDQTDNAALFIYSQGGHTGDVARQLLRLQPGRYQFRARTGNLPRDAAGQPSVRLECATGGARLFGGLFRDIGAGQGFAVPGNCPYQWLIIAGGGVEGDQPLPWIDDIAIGRIQ